MLRGLDRVADHVAEHAPESLAVRNDGEFAVEPACRQRHAALTGPLGVGVHGRADDLAEAVFLAIELHPPGIVEEVRHDVLDLAHPGQDGGQHLLGDPPVALGPRGQELGGHLDGAQRVPELVRDHGGHLSEGGEAVAFDELPLSGDELGHVAERADGAQRPALGLEDACQRQVGREALAVPRDRRHAASPGSPRVHRRPDLRPDPLAIAFVQDVEIAERLGRRLVPQPALPGLVQGHDAALGVGGEDAVLGAVDHRGQQALGPAERAVERVLHLLHCAAILGDPDRPLARVVQVQQVPDEVHPEVRAVPAAHVELLLERLALREQRGRDAPQSLVLLVGSVEHARRHADDVMADVPVHLGELGIVSGDPAVTREDHAEGGVLHDRLHLAQRLAQGGVAARPSGLPTARLRDLRPSAPSATDEP